ncbi:MAG TPA: hypothetical protein VKN14_14125 [Flavobacteriaceae bacterium]|nr:hypothetical protein [Flavobacteriaceae bacterium]
MENFKVESFTVEAFYPIYKSWCEKRDFPILLPENMEEVFICYRKNTMLYSCFVWTTKSKIGIIGFPLGNPDIPYKLREGGLSYLIEKISEGLKKRGFTKVWTTSGTPRVEEALIENEFALADPGVNVYIKMM